MGYMSTVFDSHKVIFVLIVALIIVLTNTNGIEFEKHSSYMFRKSTNVFLDNQPKQNLLSNRYFHFH